MKQQKPARLPNDALPLFRTDKWQDGRPCPLPHFRRDQGCEHGPADSRHHERRPAEGQQPHKVARPLRHPFEARELGVPAVLNVAGATQHLGGETLTVDGDAGVVVVHWDQA